MSHETRNLYHRGEVDPAVIRRDQGAGDGETLGRDDLDWYGDVPEGSSGEALPLVLLPPPCGVREAAIAAMEAACLPWREAFTGGKLPGPGGCRPRRCGCRAIGPPHGQRTAARRASMGKQRCRAQIDAQTLSEDGEVMAISHDCGE